MIEILIGTIASGKSMYCKRRASEGAVIINDDSIVLAVHGGNYLLYDKELKPLYKTIELAIFSSAALLKRDVIIDRGLSLTRESRLRWIGLAKSFDLPIHARVFEFASPYEHAKRRFKSNDRGLSLLVWWLVVLRHKRIYSPPLINEGFDAIIEDKELHDVEI